jgi:hypothetical protein
MKLFQINEDDLAELEHTLPQVFDMLAFHAKATTPQDRRWLQRVQQILMNVRWNYAPHTDITVIPANNDEEPAT